MAEGIWRIARFTGLDQSKEDAALDPGRSPDAENVICRDGALMRAGAPRKYIEKAVPGGIVSLLPWHRSGAEGALLASSAEALYVYKEGDWQLLKDGLMRGIFSYANYTHGNDDVLLLAGGEDGAYLFDGTQLEALPEAVGNIAHICLHYERLWGAGAPHEPDTVHWSRPYAAKDWEADPQSPETGGGFVLVPTFNGGRVRALMTLFGDVVVFKDADIFRIYGTYPGNYEVVQVHGIVGPVAERSIVTTGDKCFFLSAEGLCVYDGVRAVPIGDGRAKKLIEGIDEARMEMACSQVSGNTLYMALPSRMDPACDVLMSLDLADGATHLRTGLSIRCMLPWRRKLLVGGPDGFVWAMDEKGTDGVLPARWVTPWNDFGRPELMKTVREISIRGKGSVWVGIETEGRKKHRVVDFGEVGVRKRMRLPMSGKRMRMTFESPEGTPFTIEGGVEVRVDVHD